MKTTYKYQFDADKDISVRVQMPFGAQILKIECQDTVPYIWALVDPDEVIIDYDFLIYGTGQPIRDADELIHIATFQQGQYVWHMFSLWDR